MAYLTRLKTLSNTSAIRNDVENGLLNLLNCVNNKFTVVSPSTIPAKNQIFLSHLTHMIAVILEYEFPCEVELFG